MSFYSIMLPSAMIIIVFVSYYSYRLCKCYLEYLDFKKQGVVFNDKDGFSFFRDI